MGRTGLCVIPPEVGISWFVVILLPHHSCLFALSVRQYFSRGSFMRRCFAEADVWEDVLLRTYMWYFLEAAMWCFAGVDAPADMWCLRRYKYNPTNSGWCSCIGLPCNILLVLADLCSSCLCREKCIREFLMVFWLLLTTATDLGGFGGALWFLLDWATAADSCLVFWIGLLIS